MLKRIGFDRIIKLDWLNKTVMVCIEQENPWDVKAIDIKAILNGYISGYVNGDNKRKTINVLMRTWVNVEKEHVHIQNRALDLFKTSNEDEKLAIHWCMLILAYPVFLDITFTIGKLLELQDDFSLSMVKRRLYEIWGERSTLKYAVNKIILSVAEWGAIEKIGKPGNYKRGKYFYIKNPEIKQLLIEIYLIASKKACLQFREINKLHEFFPFEIDLKLEDFNNTNKFNLNTMNREIVVSLK